APDSVLVAVARAEGKVDEAAWAARDHEKIAAQVNAFLQSEFKDEIDLYGALEGLAAEPPPPSRMALAADLLRGHDIDPDALLEGSDPDHFRNNVSASSAALLRNCKAGEYYFNKDTLTADGIRKMKMRGGGKPTDAHIDKMLRELPASLDAEFTRRFDGHQQRMSTLLSTWLSARLALHARQTGIDLAGTVVTVSRAQMQLIIPFPPARQSLYSDSYGTKPSNGFLVSIQSADKMHQCFISNQTGQIHVLPDGESAESWLSKEHELVFDDAAARAELASRPGHWRTRVTVEQAVSGPHSANQESLSSMFHAEIEQGREAARGETMTESMVDALLNLIPFRQMVVALRKGDVPTAIVTGGLDALSLIPLIGSGIRLGGAAARSAAPWLSMGMRFGGAAGRQGVSGLRRLAGRVAVQPDRIRAGLANSAIQGWGRLRPLDVRRVAQALRPTAPGLATMLDGVATRARGATIPDGVWRVQSDAMATATAGTRELISTVPAVSARNPQGGKLALLPYGERAGAYTRVDATGQRIGALLLADSEGWLYQAMPVASLERYRISSLDIARTLSCKRINADGTIVLDGVRYARLGADYVEVVRDPAMSTVARPIWRVVAPRGVTPDVIMHRLIHDRIEGLWRRAEVPGIVGGGGGASRVGRRGRLRMTASRPLVGAVTPDAAQVARFRDALIHSMRGATVAQVDALRALLDRLAADDHGAAILNAMTACHELLGKAPEIVLAGGSGAVGLRPSLGRPVPGQTWNLDLDALRFDATEAAVRELAAVYNNLTGILQNADPFDVMLEAGMPPVDPGLERAWAEWLAQDPPRSPGAGMAAAEGSRVPTARQLTVQYLRGQVQEMRCFGGLDRAAIKALLRNQHVSARTRVNLSHRGLDSIPPLPGDIKTLSISNNPIRDWRNLPEGLMVLNARAMRMYELPADLPAGLRELDVSDNQLGDSSLVLPPNLVRLNLGRNRLPAVPDLPNSLQELMIHENNLETLPAALPRGLELLDVSNNALTRLPVHLPPDLQVLHAGHNRLEELPALPATLEELDVSWNHLRALPDLPDTLRILEGGANALEELPADLPPDLELLLVPRNRLRRLPDDLPRSLTVLAVQHNAIEDLPASIAELESCTVHVDGNRLSAAAVSFIDGGRGRPRIFYSSPDGAGGQPVRSLAQSVRYWWTQSAVEAQQRWDAIERAVGMRPDAAEFALFLDRLRTTASYRDAGFRAQVVEWLTELSRPERKTLLDETLGVCQGATESCEDRVVATWNDAQNLRRNDDVRLGVYDDRIPDVLDTARQMFRINVLTEIARGHERTRPVLDPVELYLAYLVRLRDSLGLTTVAPAMRFYDLSFVTPHDLAKARETVLARERGEFNTFLVLDYEPWQTLLRRKDAQGYAQAEQEVHRLLETTYEQRLGEEIDKLGLDPGNKALIADARKDLGPVIMREIRYRALSPLTDKYLQPEAPSLEEVEGHGMAGVPPLAQ
ncbi:MAG TPA: NEL-type E3 ubiquitin ligase domain-containing protein, partial [Bordetella sp.]|nr:NEL-type E3 ubiquitin ligase domain-containing protein [Bordetella sp.]